MPGTLTAPELHTEESVQKSLAPLWKVLFHNDDVTTMEFVVEVLMRFFHHEEDAAVRIMLTVHRKGIGLAGVYPLEIAELKQEQVISAARPYFPLRVTLERAR